MLGPARDDRERRPAVRAAAVAHRLVVYVVPGCPGWSRAQALAAVATGAGVPGLEVRVVDLSRLGAAVPDCVVASPTWVLDGHRIAFGNPDPDWLLAQLSALAGGE